ncbi:hypothetical protein Q2T42_06180 [Leptolyngbya boryana CZ1]|uniref:Uncharacterized protein n=1 Tax=Leptolyngbya boryana CZ1 TaxID=3060204 RepID=A0AA96X0A5_LEPBY|nr:hypothetical protein [Leptolyngbya boryana]WNZ47419.1 hypothetical protein Q2T42_06180 [Leptolyngbya boryana CZ1]
MSANDLTPLQLRRKGLEALRDALGVVGMVRFLQQFDQGSRDYTRDRNQLLEDVTIEDVMEQIRQNRDRKS